MDDAITFRALEADDFPAVHAMNQAAIPAVSSVSLDELKQLHAMSADFVVAQQGATLAGFLILIAPGARYTSMNYQWISARYPDFLYVDRIVVDPTFHRRGIASNFYSKAWDSAAGASGVLCCEVNVIPPNPESMAFHRQLGFHEVGQQATEGGAKRVSYMVREA